ncbi:MAG: urate hydroxylase PuuD [Alphaproteobacteria bacterium]|mgnify:FL=1|nr:urate hydroxylase PuuD [Alphaproteobacteria bacterium]|tara:strand:- start:109 stop:609 length:501 start_codon:yes stop_codon:yes gene_type:complete
MEYEYWAFFFRWLHVLSGIMWIGLLWYFNFVQAPTMPKIPDDLKPAVGKYIAPEALFWFRWAALSTVATGLILAYLNDYIGQALALGLTDNVSKHATIGFGMWIGVIMAANVWFIIWPKQQIALGLVEAEADAKPAAARMAMLASRTNTMLSIPMLYAMVSAQNLY